MWGERAFGEVLWHCRAAAAVHYTFTANLSTFTTPHSAILLKVLPKLPAVGEDGLVAFLITFLSPHNKVSVMKLERIETSPAKTPAELSIE